MSAPHPSRGPCQQCDHMREGTSIARDALNLVMDIYKMSVQQSFQRKSQEENQAQGEFYAERDNQRLQMVEEWSRRPTVRSIQYCGVEELDGRILFV